jgi:hypothetical protein
MAISLVEPVEPEAAATAVVEPVVNEESWLAWVERGKRDQQATNRKLRLAAVAAFLVGLGVYFLALR